MKSGHLLLLVGLLAGCGSSADIPPAETATESLAEAPVEIPSPEQIAFNDYEELEAYYDSIGYSFENWQKGMRAIPRAFPAEIPERWKGVSGTVTVDHKKRIFFRAILPLVLRANEFITLERQRAEQVLAAIDNHEATSDEVGWLVELATRYGLEVDSAADIDDEALLERVDIVPTSLALGQAAYESGYATSRFAGLGNALYGQWTWSDDGIKPDQQRKELGDHRIAAFKTPLDSVRAYQHNLNTHRAYAALRAKRVELRRTNQPISGLVLADTLVKYSEKGGEYVKTLKSIISRNRLAPTDEAYLRDDFAPVMLVPASSAGSAAAGS